MAQTKTEQVNKDSTRMNELEAQTGKIDASKLIKSIVTELKEIQNSLNLSDESTTEKDISLSYELDQMVGIKISSTNVKKHTVNYDSGKWNVTFRRTYINQYVAKHNGLSVKQSFDLMAQVIQHKLFRAYNLWAKTIIKDNKEGLL